MYVQHFFAPRNNLVLRLVNINNQLQQMNQRYLYLFALLFTFQIHSQTTRNLFMSPHYLVREPSIKSENPPLLVLLHGYGSNEKDLFSFANQLSPQFLVVS